MLSLKRLKNELLQGKLPLCWLFKKIRLPIPPILIGGYYPVNTNARWGTGDGSVTWDEACATNITGVQTSDIKVLLIQIDNDGSQGTDVTFKLQYSKDGGAWTDVAVGNDWVPYDTAAFADGDTVTANTCAAPTSGDTWENGEKDEDNAISHSFAKNAYSEFWFAIQPANAAPGSVYKFRIYDTTEGAEVPYGDNLSDYISATISQPPTSKTLTEAFLSSDLKAFKIEISKEESLALPEIVLKEFQKIFFETKYLVKKVIDKKG